MTICYMDNRNLIMGYSQEKKIRKLNTVLK